jgi:hypothetical protein
MPTVFINYFSGDPETVDMLEKVSLSGVWKLIHNYHQCCLRATFLFHVRTMLRSQRRACVV